MADNTEIVHEIVMGDGKKIKVKKSDWDAMSDKYINKFGDGRLLMTDKKGNKGYIPLSSYNDALEKGMHATRMGADLNQYSRVMSNYKDKYISQGNDNMSRPASTQQTRQTQAQPKVQQVQVAQQRPVASRQQTVQSAQAPQTKQVQVQQAQSRQATQGRQAQSKGSGSSGVLKTAKLRRGGKDYEIPWQEINAEGGLGKYIANHDSKEAPIRVYMRDAKGKLFHVDARQVNNYRGKGYKFEVGRAKRWQPTASEKAAMMAEWQEMADNTKDVMRGYQRSANRAVGLPEDWNWDDKTNYEQGHAAIEQEKNRRKAAEFGAQLQGIDTKPLGLFSGGGLSGANGGEKTSSQQGQSPFAMANAKSPEVNRVVMKDGKPSVEWVLPDGSVTTDIMEADKAEYYARKERGRRSGEAELRKMGLNPLSPMAISTQQAWKNLANEWGEKQAAQIREMLGNSDATKQAWEITDQLYKEADGEMKAAAKRNADKMMAEDKGVLGGMETKTSNVGVFAGRNFADYLNIYDLMDMSDKVWGMMDDDKKDELRKTAREQGYTSAEDIERYARAKSDEVVYDYAKRRNAPKGVLDLFVRNVINTNTVTSLAKGLMRMGTKKQGDLDAKDMAYAEYGKEHPVWNVAGNVFGVGFDPVTWVSGWVGGKAGKFALSLYGRRLEKMYQLAKGAGKGIAAAKGSGKLLAGIAGGAGNFATFEAGGEIKQQIEKGGAVGDDGRVHGYSAGRVIGAAAKGAGMGAVMGAGSHFISKGASKAMKKTDNAWGQIGISAAKGTVDTLWSASILTVPEWFSGEFDGFDAWWGNVQTMAGFKAHHAIKAAPSVIRELTPYKNPVSQAERMHNRKSFVEHVQNIINKGNVNTWITLGDKEELARWGYQDFYDLFRARDKDGVLDTKTNYSTNPQTQEYKDAFVRMEEFIKDERVSQRLRSKMYAMLTGRALPQSGFIRASWGETEDGSGYVATFSPDGKLVTFDLYKDDVQASAAAEKLRKECQRYAVGYAEDFANGVADNELLIESLIRVYAKRNPEETRMDEELVRSLVDEYRAMIAKPKDELTAEERVYLDMMNSEIIANHRKQERRRPEGARELIRDNYGVDVDAALRKGYYEQTEREQKAIEEYVRLLMPKEEEFNRMYDGDFSHYEGVYVDADDPDKPNDPDDGNGGGEPPVEATDPGEPPVEAKPVEATDANVNNDSGVRNVGNDSDVRNVENVGDVENVGGLENVGGDGVPPTDGQPEQSRVPARMQAAEKEYDAALDELTRVVGEDNVYKIINEIGAKEYLDYLKGEGITSGAEFDAVSRLIAADEAIDQANRDLERDLGYQNGLKIAKHMTDEELAAELTKAGNEANDTMPNEYNIGYIDAISDTLRDRQKKAVEEKELSAENDPSEPNEANEVDEAKKEEAAAAGAPISDETNEFGKPFILSSDGTTTFGSIQEDSGLKAAPIKLSLGENFVDENGINHGYGLLHIEAGHGKQIKDAGFSTIEEFVETVAKNYDTIREGGIIANNQTYLLEISDKHNNTLFIQLSRDGSYWNINSAGIFKKKYSRRKPEVFTRPALKTETNTDSSGVNSGQLSGVTAPAGNSPQTSDGKGSESFSKKQGIAGNGSTLSRVPVDENGEPRFEAVDSATGWDALVEMMDGNRDNAMAIAQAQADQASKDVAAIRKREPQKGKVKLTGSVTAMAEAYKDAEKKYEEDHAAWESEMSAAVAKHERWQALAAEPEVRRKAAEEAEAKRKAEEEERARAEEAERRRKAAELAAEQAAAAGAPIDWNTWPNWTDEPPAEGRNRGGFRRDGSALVKRQGKVEGVPGKETSSKFATEVIVPGQYMVIEADDIQPSHIQGQSNPLHFITEAQPKDRKDVVSVASAQKIASNVRPEEITSAVTAYTGVPTVNARGEVIQGNNRADALKILGGYTESAARYKQYLIDHAADFGIDPEAVAKMKNPVLVNRLDVSDSEAIRLGQYTQKDIESGGDERIDPGTTLTKMGDKVQSFTNILFQGSADQDMSISELISANGHEALRWLLDHGCISDNQYTSALNEKGDLNADAKVDIRNIMVANLFNGAPQSLKEKFGELPAAAQKALMETVYRDMYSESDRKIMPEIHKSIEVFSELMKIPAFNEARNVEMAIKALQDYVRQYTFDEVTGEMVLPSDKFSNFPLKRYLIMRGNISHEQTRTETKGHKLLFRQSS